ncbi:hypothetical protein HS088_TW05G00419 [Tripterygium wilfordii]|uniref:Uncharacterized protein n=1 Tax=Tripterygium wilfordii TaxID=458696 RepID=A0A7J7DMU4_TRIWF|nr:uncharacterized protein LOC119998830 isoform X1 [Tripterygium wilfordii]KAF5747692.1 hypothetical protein HS088_TW05G00419 [Tripterygium wilfordii]
MDSGVSTDKWRECTDSADEALKKSDGTTVLEARGSFLDPTTTSVALGPITPDSDRESGEVPDFGSPITVLRKPAKPLCFDLETSRNQDPFVSIDDSSSRPRTPKGGVFDPFAPGPDRLAPAPFCKKYFDKSRINVGRRLSFDSSYNIVEDAGFMSEEEMFDALYENLLEVIVTKQAEDALSEISNIVCDFDACQTPPSAPRLTGIADTCPGAPIKPTGKSRNFDLGLCRKLEF